MKEKPAFFLNLHVVYLQSYSACADMYIKYKYYTYKEKHTSSRK